ncbi:MBL fold metallo-hydrolase [Myxococcota bacterium]|nr:MBL fold metallo-hydrolase [Myxococcota bacterium]
MKTALTLFEDSTHRNVLLPDFGHGLAVQANQHLVIHGREAMILDPGGHKVYSKVLGETSSILGATGKLRYVFLSHQDPDIIAAVNGWLMTTDADAWISSLWVRFVPHFGLDRLVEHRLHPIPDEGTVLELGGSPLYVIPAHFLHSPGNFQVYDPVSKILYSGDLGASLGIDYDVVTDFDAHLASMTTFHRRYMSSGSAMRSWAKTVAKLDIETIAPQHGALFRGRDLVRRFVDWCASLDCGVDLLPEDGWPLPRRP